MLRSSSLIKSAVSRFPWPKPSIFDRNGVESHLIKWVSLISSNHQFMPSKIGFLSGVRGFCTVRKPPSGRLVKAQSALLEYLRDTRGLSLTEAERISQNSPKFLSKILGKVAKGKDVGLALRGFFRCHSINEFEPFFESLGFNVTEISLLLPQNLMHLSDDQELLESYRVLYNYGFKPNSIGMMYKDADEIFRYMPGVLDSKLRAYEEVGLCKNSIIKIITFVPTLLVGEVQREFVRVLEVLEGMGIERDWIGGVLSNFNVYNWGKMLMILQFFIEIGLTKEETGALIRGHPDFLLDGSGKTVFSMVALLLKVGGARSELVSLFSQFPNIHVGCFQRNLFQGLLFLFEIEMDNQDIRKLLCTNAEVFGSCSLRKTSRVLRELHVGKKRMCQIINENPHQLEKYVFGSRGKPLPNSGEVEKQSVEKRPFLLRLGFVDDSPEMKKALTVFRGKVDELEERYEFLVKTGLDPNDVSNLIVNAPHVLNQKIDVLKRKIGFLVNNLEYPLSSLVAFPSYMLFSVKRLNLRFLMYQWLKERGALQQALALSTLLAYSDRLFIERYVSCHPEALKVWMMYGGKKPRLQNSVGMDQRRADKRKFLLRVGFVDGSLEMKKAFTACGGRGDELQERYNFLVKCGLDPDDVSKMIRKSPRILDNKIEVLQSKIDFLVNNMGCPLISLLPFPSFLAYRIERINLRFSMYKWLKERGLVPPKFPMTSFLSCSDEVLKRMYVSRHPEGLKVWKKFQKQSIST